MGAGNDVFEITSGLIGVSNSGFGIYDVDASAYRLAIDSSGRLLIGTTTEGDASADNLTVADSGESGITVRSGSSNGGHIYFSDATSGSGEYTGGISYQHNGDFMKFNTNATERMRINSSGSVNIGSTGYGGGGASPILYLRNTSGRQVKIHSTANGTCGLQLSNSTTGEGEDAGFHIAVLSTGDGYINNPAAKNIRFATTGTERMRILAGGGLTFNGDTAAANALNDYEEGTFTPNWDAGGGVTFSYSQQHGWYTKIGNTVTFTLYLQGYASTITSGNGSNGVALQGLPFAIQNNNRYYPAFTIGRTYKFDINSDQRIYSYGSYGSTNARFIMETDDSTGNIMVADQLNQNTCELFLSGTYRI